MKFIKPVFTCALLLLLCSCSNKKDKLIVTYYDLRHAIEEGRTDFIIANLDENSYKYFQTIVDTSFLNIQSAAKFGSSLGLELTSAFLANHISSYVKATGDTNAFFQFFSNQYITPFDFDLKYELVTERSRVGKENYVVLGLHQFERRYLKWVKFSEVEGSYKLDLIYLLQLHERQLYQPYLEFREINKYLPEEEMLDIYIEHHLRATISVNNLNNTNSSLHYH